MPNDKHEQRMQDRCKQQGHQFILWQRSQTGDFEICKWCNHVRCNKTDSELIQQGFNDAISRRRATMRETLDRRFD